jgi:hypothetical protein
MTRPRFWPLSLAFAALLASAAAAQQPRPIEVRPARAGPVLGPVEYEVGSSIAWLSDTSLSIIDGSEHQVVVLHISGREIARLGRSGRGPGEFAGLTSLLASERGEIVAADMLLSRLSFFDARLGFVRSVHVPGMPTNLLRWHGSTLALAWTNPGPSGGGPTVGTVDLAAGTVTPAFAVFRADSALGAPMRVAGMAIPPARLASATARDGVFLFARTDQYRIVGIDSAGVVRRTIGRPELRPVYRTSAEVQADEAMLRRAMQRGMQSAGVTPPPEVARIVDDARREALARPKHFLLPVLTVDQLGRLWAVANRGSGDSTEVDVFSPGGEFLQTVVFPHRVAALSFRLPRVAVLSQHRGGPSDEQSEVSLYLVSGGAGTGSGRRD